MGAWQPGEPYLKSPKIAQCPAPHFGDGVSEAFTSLRTINRPEIANERTVTVWHAYVPESGRVVATCGNHVTAELERPSPTLASYRELRKGTYLVVREDGSAARVPSGQITFEYLRLDGTWGPEPGSDVASQVWRFPNEPWPPITPNLWAPFGP
ncbi:MAG: hypothetical protein ACO1SV_09390 [Fimbriimonas sp.]